MWLDDIGDLVRVLGVGLAAYAVLVTVLRLSGKRTLAKLNAFDLVVTVAFGSVLATALLSPSTSLADAAMAFVVLAGAQFAVARLALRLRPFARMVRAEPRALVIDGVVDEAALRAERVSVGDVRAAVRQSGHGDLAGVAAVVLETDGGLSVVDRPGTAAALADVRNWDGKAGASAGKAQRSTREVIDDHLACRKAHDLDADLRRNYSADVVLLSAEGVHHGHEGVRHLARILRTYVPEGRYDYRQVLADGDVAMLQWTAEAPEISLHDGADSYVVRDGRIVVQTIHYSASRHDADSSS